MKTATTTIDQLEQLLISDEAQIARLRARQITTLRARDLAQVALADGSRSLAEWAAARMDMAQSPPQRRRFLQPDRRGPPTTHPLHPEPITSRTDCPKILVHVAADVMDRVLFAPESTEIPS